MAVVFCCLVLSIAFLLVFFTRAIRAGQPVGKKFRTERGACGR